MVADKVLRGFLCGQWKMWEEGPITNFETMKRRKVVARCDQPDGHDGYHLDSVILVNWPNEGKEHVSPQPSERYD